MQGVNGSEECCIVTCPWYETHVLLYAVPLAWGANTSWMLVYFKHIMDVSLFHSSYILAWHKILLTGYYKFYSGARLSRRPRGMKNGAEITDHRVKRKPIWRQNINMRLKFLYTNDVR